MPGTVTFAVDRRAPIRKIVATCTADASAATFPDTALPKFSGHLLSLKTNPGTPGPTNVYDLVVDDDDGLDILQGVGADLLIATSEDSAIVRSGTEIHPPVSLGDTLTQKITNNAVNSAVVVITYYIDGVIAE